MTINQKPINSLDWAKGDGLLPAIIQHATEGRVLMLGYMNADALRKTIETGQVTFFSRSKQRLWTKGESSGHVLDLVGVKGDCDRDTPLVQAIPRGPTCHLGTQTCFGEEMLPPLGLLAELESLIQSRTGEDSSTSYTARLLSEGVARCAQKVGEEGVEVALAAVQGQREELNSEAADLLYHLLVCLHASGSSLQEVLNILRTRRKH